MRTWSWLVAGAALSCSSSQRDFSTASDAGSAGRPQVSGEAGFSNGGAAAGGSSNGGATAGSAAAGEASNGGAAAGEAGEANEPTAGDQGQDPTCNGCFIGKACIEDGARNPSNACQICNPSLANDSYSPNAGARCGSGATECSGQDTCDERGTCQANDLELGEPCSTGACETGVCKQNPFDCIAPNPPTAVLTAETFGFTSAPPSVKGGVIADGRYTPTRIDLYDSLAIGLDIRTFEFKKGFVQIASRYYTIDTEIAYIPEVQFSGSFTGSGNLLKFKLERCDPQYDIDIPNLAYTATANGLITFVKLADGTTVVTSYLRQ